MPGMGDANIPQRSHLHRQDVLTPCDQADMGFGEMQSSLQFVYGQHASAQNDLTLLTKQWRAAVESAAREHIWMQCTSIRSHMNYTLARCVTCKQGVCQSSLCQATAFFWASASAVYLFWRLFWSVAHTQYINTVGFLQMLTNEGSIL